ncbi:transglutaminase-like domain-containing protein [Nocardioides jensenii]|uniref:transglutaminase-like domain-containing protein n=1 Tax=Nocardioides jensenii TaxID=1843 RepID=UPI00082E4B02|nr:transglutaminase-like domain-containing protein [Nocardioides jensenii]
MSATGTHSHSRSVFTGTATRRAGPWQSPLVRRGAVDLAAVTGLLALGAIGFGPVFGEHVGYVAAGGGVLLGLAIGTLGAWRKWSRLGTLLAGMLGYLLLGGPIALPSTTIAGVLPTLETIQRLTVLSWQSWRDLLTVGLPAGQFDGPAVVPFLTGLVTATLASSAVLRLRTLRWAVLVGLLAPFVLLVVGILWGSHLTLFPAVQGALFGAVALVWVSWRSRLGDPDTHAIFARQGASTRVPRMRQALIGAATLLVAGALAIGVTGWVAPHPDRNVLRDHVVPPLDLRAYPSPLTSFRNLSATLEKETLFTVQGLHPGGRIRLAAMDLYDGDVYSVTEKSAAFEHAGETILPGEFSDQDAETDELDVRIEAYDGVWLPGGGDLRGVDFTGGGAEGRAAGLFFNPATGTALTTAGIGEGTTYTVEVARADNQKAADLPLDLAPDLSFRLPTNTARVDAVGNKLADFTAEAVTPMEQLRQIEATFRRDGFFANGTDEGIPSYAGHTITRIAQLLDGKSRQMIGDDEQYAVAFALMARELGLPARVVMGFYPPADRAGSDDAPVEVTGDDAHVWAEVRFEGAGWVTFDPTPPEDQKPDVNTPEPNPRNEPQMLPPPEVPEEADPREPPKASSDVDRDQDDDVLSGVWKWIAVGGGLVLLLALPFLLIALAKSRRRQRRRRAARLADRISGGWSEIIDLATDVGLRVPRHSTRVESAMLLGNAIPTSSGLTMAHRVDSHVFGVDEPTDADADSVWEAVDGLRGEFREGAGARDRFRARFSLRSLLAASRERRTTRARQRADAKARERALAGFGP